jgi:cellulose biosynthesis protein BcsQ
LTLGYKYIELEDFYNEKYNNNLRDGLSPAFESKPKLIEAVDCIEVDGQDGLFLLPGHIRLAEYDVTLGIAQELTGSIQTLKNLPGSINYLLNKTAEKYEADYILIDMSPSVASTSKCRIIRGIDDIFGDITGLTRH